MREQRMEAKLPNFHQLWLMKSLLSNVARNVHTFVLPAILCGKPNCIPLENFRMSVVMFSIRKIT